MNRRILFVIDNLGSGGAQNQMTLLAQLLQRRNFHIECFTYHGADFFKHRLIDSNIPVHLTEKKSKLGIGVIRSLSKLIHSVHYDLVIAFLQTPAFYCAVVKYLSRQRIPLLISERFISFEKKGSLKYRLKKFTHKVASFASTNSHHERLRIINKGIGSAEKIQTIYNMVDLEKFKPTHPHSLFDKLLCVASVSPYKNGLVLIEAMNILAKSNTLNFKLTWVGNKVFEIAERAAYIQEMENKIVQYSLSEYWQWVEPTTDILQYYVSHDALVHPSYREGLPNVVCEALSCGLPVILSNTLDHPTLADHGKNGFLFNYESAEELAATILKFYSLTQQERFLYKTSCRTYAERQFSEETFISHYLNIINELICD